MTRIAMAGAAAWLALAGCALAGPPQPTKPVDLSRYFGRWYEIARVPNAFEKGSECEGPTADYRQSGTGVSVVQTCHKGSPTGAIKTFRAVGRILDPGFNARLKLTFFMVVSKEYWVLDHAPDYQWAILGDPSGDFVWLLSRGPSLPPSARTALVQRIRVLGYDPTKLEFPTQR